MLDIVIERVTVADTVDSKLGSRLDAFYLTRIRRAKPATHVLGKVRPQSLRRQFRNGKHLAPSAAPPGILRW